MFAVNLLVYVLPAKYYILYVLLQGIIVSQVREQFQ
jgi:hypothetical protein